MLTIVETLEELRRGTEPIIYFSRYRADQVDNGGARRVAQLRQLLAGYEVAFVSSLAQQAPAVDGAPVKSGRSFFDRAVRTVVRCSTRKFSAEFGRWIFFSDRLAWRWIRALQGRQKPRLVLVDDPIFFPSLVRFCGESKIPVIAHCHNIETLSRGQVLPCYQQELFAREIALLAKCRAAVTISYEEAFLLRNLGMTTVALPYYPPAEVEEQLLAVRKRRMTSDKQGVLLLGSAGNTPTRMGMEQLLTAWGSAGGVPGERLYVAGYGTEVFRGIAGIAGVEFRGAITDRELWELLGTVRAGLVYQEDGAGALTRIEEYLLAGVPVVANSHAARSYHNIPGVAEYPDLSDLFPVLTRLLASDPLVPQPQRTDSVPMLRLINTVVKGD